MKKSELETYRDYKVNAIHFWSVHGLLLDICLSLKLFFNVDVDFESLMIRLLVYIFFPSIVGVLKMVFIDPFFDRISVKIKWIFAIMVFAFFAFLGIYSFFQFKK